jgi:hypothetical protein
MIEHLINLFLLGTSCFPEKPSTAPRLHRSQCRQRPRRPTAVRGHGAPWREARTPGRGWGGVGGGVA